MKNHSRSISAILCLLAASIACRLPAQNTVASQTSAPPLSTATALIAPTDTPAPTPDNPSLLPNSAPSQALTGLSIPHLAAGTSIDITNIHMISASDGWAIGGQAAASDHIFRTQDGGATWRDVTPPQPMLDTDGALNALGFFMDAATAWVVYGGSYGTALPTDEAVFWRTSDAGATWQYSTAPQPSPSEAFSPALFAFTDAQHGWLMVVIGGGMMHQYVALYSTNDSGVNWNMILDPSSEAPIQSFPKTAMAFADAQIGWLTRDAQGVSDTPHLFRTQDSGINWRQINLPAPSNSSNLFNEYSCGTYALSLFAPDSVIVALKCLSKADYQTQSNFQYASTDDGQTWTSLPLPSDYSMNDGDSLYYFDANNGFAFGRNIYRTSDGGKTWASVNRVNWDGQFNFVNLMTGWAVARADADIALVVTNDGGARWSIVKPTLVAP